MTKQKIIIDTDPGVDDAIAIMLLAKTESIDIQAITTVAGNSSIQNTTANAEYLKDLLSLNCPIYSGATESLTGPFIEGQVHGVTGLTGITHSFQGNLTNNAAEKIIEIVNTFPNEITVLCLGPQTNLAQAIQKDPTLPSKIKQIVIMGGAIQSPGNKSWVAEFNIFLDPEAAANVFNTPTPKVLVPLEICYKTPLFVTDLKQMTDDSKLKPILTSLVMPYIKLLSQFEGVDGAIIYDALAAYYLVNPASFTTKELEIKIETKGEFTRGMSVADLRTWGEKNPNTTVATALNRDLFIQDLLSSLSK
ncbi:hypothetical protein A2572_02285 [Candidatus Collierbacteria bacterium RIFOXYD1_FULL_40_9]|uniref:Inosine/uridine-preferring nucleoside hydrolase domain-containing protein n=1 Tax=Candidatus Collierbacteria bacterium RIFOXYD1_FULL_40_9 TaxID=1817731 RepID=A0A1F5FNZ4_9BACT|nr:MAG: hypothetical protein A2572_02285 [Candidatus Collierbacteria bacterium RIFOXYD1_FULL_40_9]